MDYHESLRKADEWIQSNCWLAVFDILGFRNLISVDNDDFRAFSVRVAYQETIRHLETSCHEYQPGALQYAWFSDTFLMYAPDDSAGSYQIIQRAAKSFIERCTDSQIPIRGAIAVGSLFRTADDRSFIGNAFLEAFEYAEDQDWIGLLITPNAVNRVASYGVCPTHHDFVQSNDIPMRKCEGQKVLAYRLQRGASNFPPRLLRSLRQMQRDSDEKYRDKYERTMQFIRENTHTMTRRSPADNMLD
jgi:hypothetical protein